MQGFLGSTGREARPTLNVGRASSPSVSCVFFPWAFGPFGDGGFFRGYGPGGPSHAELGTGF
jgi:hypothetical protein